MNYKRFSFLVLSFGLLFLMSLPQPAAAQWTCYCDNVCEWFGDCCVWWKCIAAETVTATAVEITSTGSDSASVAIKGGRILGDSAHAVLFKRTPGIQSINSLTINDALTGRVLRILQPTNGGELAASDQGWSLFKFEDQGSASPGTAIDIVFDVTLKQGANVSELVAGLKRGGVLAEGPIDLDGTLDSSRISTRTLNSFDIRVVMDRKPMPLTPRK